MSRVESFEEVLDGLHEDYAECKDPKKSLRAMWNAAIEVACWAIHDVSPGTYPGRKSPIPDNADTALALAAAARAVKSLKEEAKDGD